ncbi:hypothetical protein, partial [Xanthomonas hortorum]|uniref:hypothetical protein n=1 Tax=Xanthomonas hortorum TaxID=56454 RepID=UPI002044A587
MTSDSEAVSNGAATASSRPAIEPGLPYPDTSQARCSPEETASAFVWSRWQALPRSAEAERLERLLAAMAIYLARTCEQVPLQIKLRYIDHTHQLTLHPRVHDACSAICEQVHAALDECALRPVGQDDAQSKKAQRGDVAHAWPTLIEIGVTNDSAVIVGATATPQLQLQICKLRKRFRCGLHSSHSTRRQALRVGARLRCLLTTLERGEAQHGPVALLPLLPASERRRLLQTFNCSHTRFPQRG